MNKYPNGMNLYNKTILAYRYLRGHFSRYIFLLIAVGFGFSIITSMTSMYNGMTHSVNTAAMQHYGGDLFVLGFDRSRRYIGHIPQEDLPAIREAVKISGVEVQQERLRTSYMKEGTLFFAGSSIRQKYIHGIDADVESREIDQLDFAESSPSDRAMFNTGEGILISETSAEKLGARLGDDLVLQVRTHSGQINTATMVVRGIFRDSSLFGSFKSYTDRARLNQLIGFEDTECSVVAFNLENSKSAIRNAAALRDVLEHYLPTAPSIVDKETFTREQAKDWEGVRYFVLPIEVYVSQVSELLSAMRWVSYFLFVMIVLIVLVSILITYRLIINKRRLEIGAMRAMGVQRRDMRDILILEVLMLFILALGAGAVLSLMTVKVISLFSFSSVPGFELFMTQGRLAPLFTLKSTLINICILILITSPAIWSPSNRAASMSISRALRDGR